MPASLQHELIENCIFQDTGNRLRRPGATMQAPIASWWSPWLGKVLHSKLGTLGYTWCVKGSHYMRTICLHYEFFRFYLIPGIFPVIPGKCVHGWKGSGRLLIPTKQTFQESYSVHSVKLSCWWALTPVVGFAARRSLVSLQHNHQTW